MLTKRHHTRGLKEEGTNHADVWGGQYFQTAETASLCKDTKACVRIRHQGCRKQSRSPDLTFLLLGTA